MGDEVESNRILYFSPTCVCVLSHIRLFETPGTVARQAPLSMGISRQEYWSGVPLSSPGDLPDAGVKPASSALAGGFFTPRAPGEPLNAAC